MNALEDAMLALEFPEEAKEFEKMEKAMAKGYVPRYMFWSGGADSTYMMVRAAEEGLRVDKFFFSDTGMEFPEMYEYIAKVEEFMLRKYNITIEHLEIRDGYTYKEWSRGTGVIRGKEQVRGIPRQLEPCWLQRNAKIRPFEKWLKDNGIGDHLIYIGYTADELKRAKMKVALNNEKKLAAIEKLNDEEKVIEILKFAKQVIKNENAIVANNHLYPLVMWDVDGNQVKKELQDRGILNPLYVHFDRTGCFMCPKVDKMGYYRLWKYYPKQWKWMRKEEKKLKKLNAFNSQFNKDQRLAEMEVEFEKYGEDAVTLRDTEDKDFCFCII